MTRLLERSKTLLMWGPNDEQVVDDSQLIDVTAIDHPDVGQEPTLRMHVTFTEDGPVFSFDDEDDQRVRDDLIFTPIRGPAPRGTVLLDRVRVSALSPRRPIEALRVVSTPVEGPEPPGTILLADVRRAS